MSYFKKRKRTSNLFVIFLSFIFLFNLVSADLSLGVGGELGVDLIPTTPINYSIVNVNNSNFWDNLNTPLDITFTSMWNRSGTDVFLNHIGDNVGIGTDNPSLIQGWGVVGTNLMVNSEDSLAMMTVRGDGSRVNMVDRLGGLDDKWMQLFTDAGVTKFRSVNDNGGAVRTDNILVMDMGTGNVGIGTASPNTITHIRGSTPILRVEASAGSQEAQLQLDAHDNTGSAGLYFTRVSDTATNYAKIGWTGGTSGAMYFTTDAVERMRIDSVGNVGIGTTNPKSKLQLRVDGDIATWGGFNFIPASSSSGSANIIRAGGSDQSTSRGLDLQIFDTADGLSDAQIKLRFSAVDSQGTILFDTSGSERMRIDSNGNVGIGTTTPNYPLEVSFGVSNISAYFHNQTSATGYITRTSVYDKSKGSPFDFIKDADYYKKDGEIDHKKFYGYTSYKIRDTSKPEYEFYDKNVLNFTTTEYINKSTNETYLITTNETITLHLNKTIYPYTKIEEGVLLDSEVDLLRQAVYELNKRVDFLENNCILK